MNILCKILGHKSVKGWCNGIPYFEVRKGGMDGMGTIHAYLFTECERCGEKFHIGNIHLPETEEKKIS